MKVSSFCYSCRRKVTEACDAQGCPKASGKFRNKNKPTNPVYQSREWRVLIRPRQLRKQPLCVECLKENRSIPATVVDHIEDWKKGINAKERERLFTSESNLQSLCASHHNSKTAKTNRT